MAYKEIYFDSAAGAGGDGTTPGTAYNNLQSGLDSDSHDQTNGTRCNLKGSFTLTNSGVDLTTFCSGGNPGDLDPLIFCSYSSTAADVQMHTSPSSIAKVTGNGGVSDAVFNFGSFNHTHIHDLEIDSNTGGVAAVRIGNWDSITNCFVHNTDGIEVVNMTGNAQVAGCRIDGNSGAATIGIKMAAQNARAFCNYIQDCDSGISLNANNLFIFRNICVATYNSASAATGVGIDASSGGHWSVIWNNTIFSSVANQGNGISLGGGFYGFSCVGNVIEGFSAVNGKGIHYSNNNTYMTCDGQHAFYNIYNNNYRTNLPDDIIVDIGDNEGLSESPFKKVGSVGWTDRLTYFEPKDIGNLKGGASFYGDSHVNLWKGAVQPLGL